MIRTAQESDLVRMVELSDLKRTQYEQYQPVFWKKATDANEKQHLFFQHQLGQDSTIALVHEDNQQITGFIIGMLRPAPPVYNPGGMTCIVDDFVVEHAELWETVGQALLDAVREAAKERGCVLMIVVNGASDAPKRSMLEQAGYPIASEWRVKPIA